MMLSSMWLPTLRGEGNQPFYLQGRGSIQGLTPYFPQLSSKRLITISQTRALWRTSWPGYLALSQAPPTTAPIGLYEFFQKMSSSFAFFFPHTYLPPNNRHTSNDDILASPHQPRPPHICAQLRNSCQTPGIFIIVSTPWKQLPTDFSQQNKRFRLTSLHILTPDEGRIFPKQQQT